MKRQPIFRVRVVCLGQYTGRVYYKVEVRHWLFWKKVADVISSSALINVRAELKEFGYVEVK